MVQPKRIIDWGLGDFFHFLRKIAITTPFESHIARSLSYLKKLNC